MAQKNVTRDMTQGSPLKLILTFSLPLLGGFLFQQLYSFMDTMVVGGVLGTEALAAVGDTGSLNFLINGFCMGICSGFAIPIAQAFGAKDETEMRRYVMHSVYLCAVISVLMGLLTGFFAPQLLRMLNTPEDILPLSVAYIQPVFFAIPVTVLYNMCGGVMRSLGDSKTPVIAITIAALLNIVLDYTFILAFHMGVEGAAWATVISQLISGLWCLLVIRKRFTILKMQPEDKRIRTPFVRRLLAMGIPFGLQYSITAIGSLTMTYAVNGIGTIAVAAVTAGGKLSMFFCCVFDALASTMATFAGQNVGAKRLDRINQGLKASSIIGCVYCILAFVAIYFFGKPLVGLFISQDSADRQLVIDMAQQFLIINSVLYIPLLFVNIVRFSIQGLGYTMIAMIAGLMELVGRAVVAMPRALRTLLRGYWRICSCSRAILPASASCRSGCIQRRRQLPASEMCPPAVCAAGVFRFFADGFCLLQGDAPAGAKSPRNTRIYYGRKLNSIARKGQGAMPLGKFANPPCKKGKMRL